MQQNIHNEEITWNVEDIPVYGTLTRPAGDGPFPAIIFVAGSGPTDRDWCSPLLPGTNGSGRLLAEALAKAGFVTLRYDKRFSGPHAMENLPRMICRISMQSHTDEVAGGVQTLLTDDHTDLFSLFVLTNSEGAIHALHYQLEMDSPKFKGMVLTGAPGRSIGQVARSQILAQIANLPDHETLMEHYDVAVTEILASGKFRSDPTMPEGMNLLLQSLATPANQPFSLELWSTNAADLLARIQEPVLVVIGKKDIQVDYQADGQALEKATRGGDNVTFRYPEYADHVLKYDPAPRGSRPAVEVGAMYNAADRILDPETVNVITRWLKEQSGT